MNNPDTICLACGMGLEWAWAGRNGQEHKVWQSAHQHHPGMRTTVCKGETSASGFHVPKSEPDLIERWLAS